MLQDESGAREMAGGADDFGAGPAVCGHDALAVEDVLDGVLRLRFFEDGVGWNSLGEGERGHGVGFDELVVRRGAGEDEMGSDPGFELANAFEGAFALFGRRGSVRQGGSSEDDDGVEVVEAGVCGWDTEISEGGSANHQKDESDEEDW